MRDRLNLPIEYDQLHFGFVYTKPVMSFPSIEVSEGEIVALFVAQKALQQYRGTSFQKPLRTAFEKITGGLQDRIDFRWAGVDAAISFRGLGASVAHLEIFETVSRAVLESHELAFEYKKLRSSRHEDRRIQPYHLGCVENQWYVFGFDFARQQLRTFALPRMRQVRRYPRGLSPPARGFLGSRATPERKVSASFAARAGTGCASGSDAFAARLVGERQWHPTQKIRQTSRGRTRTHHATLGGLEEVERWILSWGEHAQVLEPAALKRQIFRVADAILAAASV